MTLPSLASHGPAVALLSLCLSAATGCGGGAADPGGSEGGESSAASTGGAGQTASAGGTGGAGSTGSSSGAGGDDAVPRAGPGVRPDASNTGVPKGTALTVITGDLKIDKDGTVVEGKDIQGFVVIQASHVVLRRSIVRGGVAKQNSPGIDIQSGTDVLIEDVEVAIAHPSAFIDGVSGGDFTARRLNIHGSVDGMKLGSHSTVEYSFIHDITSFASDPNQGGKATHNDAIQILAGTDIHVVGNSLLPAKDQNAAIQVTQDFGVVSDLHIEQNFSDGGGCTFNFSHNGAASLSSLFTTGNRFGRNSFFDCPMLKSTKTTLTSSGDVWDDDGKPVPVQTHD